MTAPPGGEGERRRRRRRRGAGRSYRRPSGTGRHRPACPPNAVRPNAPTIRVPHRGKPQGRSLAQLARSCLLIYDQPWFVPDRTSISRSPRAIATARLRSTRQSSGRARALAECSRLKRHLQVGSRGCGGTRGALTRSTGTRLDTWRPWRTCRWRMRPSVKLPGAVGRLALIQHRPLRHLLPGDGQVAQTTGMRLQPARLSAGIGEPNAHAAYSARWAGDEPTTNGG